MKLLKTMAILLIIGSVTAFVSTQDRRGLDKKTIKYLQKHSSWRQVDDSLFFFETEISNNDYLAFLNHLKKQNKFEEYEECKVDSTGWFRDSLKYYNMAINYHIHPHFGQYPVVNISYEAVVIFCDYLTDLYNSREDKKHFFKKVKVRLPTKEEWLNAARGGLKNQIYPWGSGRAERNANFRYIDVRQGSIIDRTDTSIMLDKPIHSSFIDYIGYLTLPVRSYDINGYGLYNMCGNVAEMLSEPGTTAGGSWCTTAYYMRLDIDSDPYAGWKNPSPYIGFRPVMEVIEE